MVFFQLNVTGLLFQSFRTASPYNALIIKGLYEKMGLGNTFC